MVTTCANGKVVGVPVASGTVVISEAILVSEARGLELSVENIFSCFVERHPPINILPVKTSKTMHI